MTKSNLCSFFGRCGGCLYQDLSDSAYFEKKQNFIRRAFADEGITVNLEPIRTIPLGTRRRVSFRYEGTRLGYNALKSHQIVEIANCCLLRPEINDFLPQLRQWTGQLGDRGEVFILVTDWGLDIHIRSSSGTRADLRRSELLASFLQDVHVARLTYNDETIGAKVTLPFLPDAFLQPSAEGEKILRDLMFEGIGTARRAVDLFCGSGTFTRPLLDKGLIVKGYDCAESVKLLGENGVIRDLFRSPLSAEEMKNLDLVVLDPPRAGARAQTEQIAQTAVPRIVMISCSPKTAARDCRILLDAGWALKKVTPVDQFRWSNHIEIVCLLEHL